MTRWLVVVLLAANLGFMAWMYQRLASESPPPAAATRPSDTELRLLSEVPAETPPMPEASEAPAEADTDTAETADTAAVEADATADTADAAPMKATAAREESDFVALVPGPWTGREAPAGEDSEPPPWLALEQLAVAGPVIDRPAVAASAVPPATAPDTASSPELPPASEAATAPLAAAAAADTCLTLGPLAEEASAQTLLDWLVRRGGTAVTRPEVTGRPDAHWLYVGPFPDLSAARLESDRLRDLGVTDHLAVRHNELGPVVSLGLYATKEGRERRIATLQTAGVEPVVVPRGPREVRWWVDARLPPESGLTAEAITAAAEGSGEVQASACPDGTGAADTAEAPLPIGALPAAEDE